MAERHGKLITVDLRQRGLSCVAALVLAGCHDIAVVPTGAFAERAAVAPPTVATVSIEGIPASSVQPGDEYVFIPVATSSSGAMIRFAVLDKPRWAQFDAGTGTLHGIPSDRDIGIARGIEITAWDGEESSTVGPFSITVRPRTVALPPTAPPPTLSGTPATGIVAGQSYSFTPAAATESGDPLVFTIANRPVWASFDSATGRILGTPTAAQVGTYAQITISVSDGQSTAALAPFSIQVLPAETRPPLISGTPAVSVLAGTVYAFTPSASDPAGYALTFSIQNKPAWASFDSATGTLSGGPGKTQAGAYADIIIGVSDGRASAVLPPFTIQVLLQSNNPPAISGTPATTVAAGAAYVFQPMATDPDGDPLTFSITNKPVWASFNPASGALFGSPSSAQAGRYLDIVVAVSDGQSAASLAPFNITVAGAPDTPPDISGQPATTAAVGMQYSFTPSASDADGDSLTFHIDNKPAWAAFDPSSGTLSGTPGGNDAGLFANIIVSVSDGASSAALPAFDLTVDPSHAASVTLSWVPPTVNTDGTALTDLAGYRIYYGNTPGTLGQVAELPGTSLTRFTLADLAAGTWYFAMSAYTTAGTESDLTAPCSTVIR